MPIANDMKNIVEGIEVSYGERMSWLADATKDTHQMMTRIGRENKEAADAVAKLLAKSESTRIAEFKGMLADIQSHQRAREEEVAEMIKKFENELEEMSTELKDFLSQSEFKRLEEFKSMLADIKSKQRVRKEEVTELLAAFQKDINEARTHWQNLAKIMASKRTGKRVPIAEVPKEAEVPKKVEEAAEEAFTEGELKMKALALIRENSNGISLVQLGGRIKTPYVRLGRPIRELQDEGKVVKRDSLYFPT